MYNRFRSYERAAELLESLGEPIEEIAKDTAKLTELPGIGDRMADHIQEIIRTGDYCHAPEAASRNIPRQFSIC